MNIQRKNSAHHFRMQSEREQTLVVFFPRISGKAYSRVVLIDVMMKSYFAHVLGSSRH